MQIMTLEAARSAGEHPSRDTAEATCSHCGASERSGFCMHPSFGPHDLPPCLTTDLRQKEPAAQRMNADLHPITAHLIDCFAAALKAKLRWAQVKYGYSDGWSDPNRQNECQAHLAEHVAKGDPIDVAAYAAFCWHHGWATAPALAAGARSVNTPKAPYAPELRDLDDPRFSANEAAALKERLERAFYDAGGFHGQLVEYAARTALPVLLDCLVNTPKAGEVREDRQSGTCEAGATPTSSLVEKLGRKATRAYAEWRETKDSHFLWEAQTFEECIQDIRVAATPTPPLPSPSRQGEELAVLSEKATRERCAKLCEERADYFDKAPGHRDWKDAARSYRATAKEIRRLRPSQKGEGDA